MREYRTYIIVFATILIAYAVYDYYKPKPVNWFATYKTSDKNPFGTYILNKQSEDLFVSTFETSFATLSELESDKSVLLIADNVDVKGADLIRLFELFKQGTNVLIASSRYSREMLDTLGIATDSRLYTLGSGLLVDEQMTLSINEVEYEYPTPLISSYFTLDSAELWQIHASTYLGPSVISKQVGSGHLTLVAHPHIFTNFGMLLNDNYKATAKLLSLLPPGPVHYSMFYQFGKPGASTPFRYFLSQPPLKWVMYLALFIIAIFLIIDSWRKQRSIPVRLPPGNASIKYVQTLGALFYREGNHYRAAMKLINHFFAEIRERFLLDPEFTEKFYSHLSSKSGKEKSDVITTFELIALVKRSPRLEENILVKLSQKIDTFK